MAARLYYTLGLPTAFSTEDKLTAAVGDRAAVRKWLEAQDAYTLHRQVRKKFPRNPYTVNNLMDVWECDLIVVPNLARYNDSYRYILSAIDVFSKYLHLVPLKSKTGKAVAEAFGSILTRYSKRRPLTVQTDKGKEFLNKPFRDMLRREGIEHRTCKNPDVKCAVVERAHRTIRDKLYKYFSYKNTYRYIDVLEKFVDAYNNTVHRTTGMAPAKVGDSDVLKIWRRMNNIKTRVVKPKYSVGQHVRISKEKMHFAKGAEQNYSTEIFRVTKVIKRRPRPVYELQDLNNTPIDGQFYQEELVPVRISKRKEYKIDKILRKRTRHGIREVLVHWKGYPTAFDSWIPASSVKNV